MRVLIGLQARSNSQRLPRKIYEKIGDKTVLQWAFEACEIAADQLRNDGDAADAMILGPKDDQELKEFTTAYKLKAEFPECAENDLTSRYLAVADEFTHIVRITADCWCIHPDIIVQTIRMLDDQTHYASNTIFRTFQEGQDVQAFSKKALLWLSNTFRAPNEREHPWSRFDLNDDWRSVFKKEVGEVSQLFNRENEATMKTSIDTQEDLDIARRNYEKWQSKQNKIGS